MEMERSGQTWDLESKIERLGDETNTGVDKKGGVKNDAKISSGLYIWVYSDQFHWASQARRDFVVRHHESNVGLVELQMF